MNEVFCMSTIVMKFGGPAIATTSKIKEVAKKVWAKKQEGHSVVVVVSSMEAMRQQLRQMMREITIDPNKRERDVLLSTGAQVTSSLLAMAIEELGGRTVSLMGWQAVIETDRLHGNARIEYVQTKRIERSFMQDEIVIVAGFQGVDADRNITTLGKGGSETSAIAIAAELGADLVEIYVDVDGIYTADPNVVPTAQKIKALSYDEMLELSHLGSHILHPRAVELAKKYSIPVVVRSFHSDEEGTLLKEEVEMEKNLMVSGVAYEKDIVRLTVGCKNGEQRFLAPLFSALSDYGINVDIIVQSIINGMSPSVSFTISKDEFAECLRVLEKNKASLGFSFADFEVGLAKVSIIGSGMASNPGVAARMFTRLSEEHIPVKMVSTSEIKVSVIVPQDDMVRAANALHDEFHLVVVE